MNDNIYGCPPTDPKLAAKAGYLIVPALGSIDGNCQSCGTEITIGPRIQAHHKEHGGELLCYICLIKHPSFKNPNEVQSLGSGGHEIQRV